MAHPLTIIGNEGSPYSRKMRAVLRYRRIPHVWVAQLGPGYVPPPPVPVKVIPVLVWHNDDGTMRESMVDSTPQIQRLEREVTGRSLVPVDPVLAFLSALIEDYADEWGTKFMFHYRWTDEAGIAWARRHLMLQIDHSVPADKLDQFAQWFGDRQIGRRAVVGSSDETRNILEDGYQGLLQALNGLLEQRRFLFGDRPSPADFGLYGQLSQLCGFDPTSSRLAEQQAPRVVAWTERIEDLSGWVVGDAQWLQRDAALAALRPLLTEIGASYVPFLLANAAAKQAGSEQVICTIRGERWQQNVFAYQAKCLGWLREHFGRLPETDRGWLRAALYGTGCEALLVT